MRKGFDAQLVLNKQGEIFAIATGSDACAEHECGSRALQSALCAAQGESVERQLIEQLRKGKAVAYPNLLDRKVLNSNLDKLVYAEGVDKQAKLPAAVFGYDPYGAANLDNRELAPYRQEEAVTGAWDERSFAIRVTGEKWVKKLRQFADRVKAGDGVFAGTFLEADGNQRLGGVIIALQSQLRPEHKVAIAKAQAEWEANLRLKAKSRLEELHEAYRQAARDEKHVKLPGYLWPVWKDQIDGEVAYALNPDYGVQAAYWGPYEFDQLKDWILAKNKFELVPLRRAA